MVSLSQAIMVLYRQAIFAPAPIGNVVVSNNNDGLGDFISFWDAQILGPQPDSVSLVTQVTDLQYQQFIKQAVILSATQYLQSNSEAISLILNAIIATVPGISQNQVIVNLGNVK